MKITVIHGGRKNGSTYHCAKQFIQAVCQRAESQPQVTEFFLTQDAPPFCNGCFSCFQNGENTCPHADKVQPIAETIRQADIVVLTSPVYALDVSGQMKTLLDHLCYMWMSHRPAPEMFCKVGITIATTAGAGLRHTSKTLANSLNYWGARRTLRIDNPVAASKWEEVSQSKREKIERKLGRVANRTVRMVSVINSLRPTLFTRFFFALMKSMMKGNTWCKRDRDHWEIFGWLSGTRPF